MDESAAAVEASEVIRARTESKEQPTETEPRSTADAAVLVGPASEPHADLELASSLSVAPPEATRELFDPTDVIRNNVPESGAEYVDRSTPPASGPLEPQAAGPPAPGQEASPSSSLAAPDEPVVGMANAHQPPDQGSSVAEQLVQPERSSPSSEDIPSAAPLVATDAPTPVLSQPAHESFLSSLTSRFNGDTQSAWSQFFGSRYEDAPLETASEATNGSHTQQQEKATTESAFAGSLRAKLERERKLDLQIQAIRQKCRERATRQQSRVVADSTAPAAGTRRRRRRLSSSASSSQTHRVPPLEKAGFSTTAIRVAMENAQRATCDTFRQLHALVQDEPIVLSSDLGVFVTLWELDTMLHELFGSTAPSEPHDATPALTLALHHADYAAFPLETLLQVSWFLPLDDFSRLRSCVAHVARKHLSERRLAVLNMALRRQLLLLPHGVQLQQCLVQIMQALRSDTSLQEANTNDNQRAEAMRIPTPVENLLKALRVPFCPTDRNAFESTSEFMRLSPFEIAARLRLSSVVCTQRVVFFRCLRFTASINSKGRRDSPPVQHDAEMTEPSNAPPAYSNTESPAAIAASTVEESDPATVFPPPYAITGPAYWTFEPPLPTADPTAPSVPKHRPTESPGVGAYDVTRGDRLVFPHRPSVSFARGSPKPVAAGQRSTPRRPQSVSKSPVHRTIATTDEAKSLVQPSDDVEGADDEDDEREWRRAVEQAMRAQQSFVLDDMVQSLLQIQREETRKPTSSRPQSARRSRGTATRDLAAPVSPLLRPTRRLLVDRVRRQIPGSAASTASMASPTRRHRLDRKPQPVEMPPRDHEPPADDAHLAWATHISSFYSAQQHQQQPQAPLQ
ncbi:hypothetical protein P43SY_003887 [Pythium insidiosum]|uniref:Uncharacterized protein n=1 Tax=Pythium insidiosum TaxID=114742 RepID=A0AAD5Q516_PYTIN|nr:hypothetical protein P43SY_003887 [Pythium insidiosum]